MPSHPNCFCILGFLLSFSQLTQYSLQNLLIAGSSSKSAASTAKAVGEGAFWTPHSAHPSFATLRHELDPIPQKPLFGSLLSNVKSRFKTSDKSRSNPPPVDFRQSNFPVITSIKDGHPYSNEVKFDPANLPDHEPSKLYFRRLPSNQADSTSIIAHLATLKVWNHPNPTPAEFEPWLGVLNYALITDRSPDLKATISIQYDLNSLKIKHRDIAPLMERIETAEGFVKQVLKSQRGAVKHYTWGKEMFAASSGLSDDLQNFKVLEDMVKGDPTFKTALTADRVQDQIKELETIISNFNIYNSYKRIHAIAILYHTSRPRYNPAGRLITKLRARGDLLPNERNLLNWIDETRKNRISPAPS